MRTVTVGAGLLFLLMAGESPAQERTNAWGAGLAIGSLELEGRAARTGAGGYFGFGRAINENLLLGAEASLWTTRGNTSITQSLLTAAMDVYPVTSVGILLKFGLSLAHLTESNSDSAFGLALGVGLGVDIPTWDGFWVRPSFDLTWGAAGTVTSLWEVGIGLSWN